MAPKLKILFPRPCLKLFLESIRSYCTILTKFFIKFCFSFQFFQHFSSVFSTQFPAVSLANEPQLYGHPVIIKTFKIISVQATLYVTAPNWRADLPPPPPVPDQFHVRVARSSHQAQSRLQLAYHHY